MSAAQAIADFLGADPMLGVMLTGGIHRTEISRQDTPNAFDNYGELLPCVYVQQEAVTPWGPHDHSARLYLMLWFYQQHGYQEIEAARRRTYQLLHKQRLPSNTETIYEIAHSDDSPELEDQALQVSMGRSRYVVTMQRG